MNQSQQHKRTYRAVQRYIAEIDVPEYHESAVCSRMQRNRTAWSMPRLAASGVAACAALAILAIGTPRVFAQVESMLHAFSQIGGQRVPIAVNSVTLDQARRDMPFAVIAPAAIPAGLSERIDELNPSSSRLDAKLAFRFSAGNGVPELTIVESRAQQIAAQRIRLWMTTGTQAPPEAPQTGSGDRAFVQVHDNSGVTRPVLFHAITWVAHGTRIDLISPPGLLSQVQLAAIRRAMLGR